MREKMEREGRQAQRGKERDGEKDRQSKTDRRYTGRQRRSFVGT